ncbi:Crp/Fnr family transcriptional regulator [Labilibaculum sp. DW002]|uniref:Crp/Fnr family transcriptional regulator n=1 Tax=Paralabilibaculum antarcticum TaxID=2912572 RepID=A0ABT5VXD1_9BACT|nr:Crp/Fnr family transcriptional regulator [Labilibaculum sp. DW002]MDE5420069.1 Crp/Fnr family transcriptional regulator [Labilibaculum sp. DW002]
MKDNILWYFENFNFLDSLSMKEKMELSDRAKMLEAKKNQTIYLPSDVSNSIYFLKEGKVKISSFSDDGKELIFAILGPGEIFGELAIAGQTNREQIAATTEDAIICYINVEEFENFLASHPRLSLKITKLIGFRLKKIRSRLERMWFKSAAERVKSLLSDLIEEHGIKIGDEREIRLNLTHQDIANLAATTRQTVTSTFNELEREGIITYDRRRILVRKPKELT